VPLIITSFLGAPTVAYFTEFFAIRTLILLFALAMIFTSRHILFTSGRTDKVAGEVKIGQTLYKGLVVKDFLLQYNLNNSILTVKDLSTKVADG
jgi:hypothetical protein